MREGRKGKRESKERIRGSYTNDVINLTEKRRRKREEGKEKEKTMTRRRKREREGFIGYNDSNDRDRLWYFPFMRMKSWVLSSHVPSSYPRIGRRQISSVFLHPGKRCKHKRTVNFTYQVVNFFIFSSPEDYICAPCPS